MPAIEPGALVRARALLRPNAAMMDKLSLCKLGTLRWAIPGARRADGRAGRAYPHIDIWGGCCGTWDTHLEEIARNVRAARGLGAAL